MGTSVRILLVLVICIFGSLVAINLSCGSGNYTGGFTNPTNTGSSTSTGTGTSTDASGGHGGQTGTSTQSLGGVAGCIVYTPSSYSEGTPVRLLLTWHGNGGSPSDMVPYWQPVASSKGFILISVPHPIIDSEASANSEAAKGPLVRDDAFTKYNILKKEVYVNGFSGGGQVAFNCAINHAGFAGNICMSSCPAISSTTWPDASGHIPIWWRVGDADNFFPPASIAPLVQTARDNGHNVNYQTISGGHTLGIHDFSGSWTWVTSN